MKVIKQSEEKGKHYLYIHTRLDTGNVFYVGIGTKYRSEKDYSRSKCVTDRNNIWQGIKNKTEYSISILYENDNYDFIKSKEIELIEKYGQIIKNNGTLCNLSLGGDGTLGYRNKNLIKPVYLYLKTGEFYKDFVSYIDCSNFLSSSIKGSVDKNHLIKGFIIKSYKTDCVEPINDIKDKLKIRLSKTVYQYDDNFNFIKEWPSSSEVQRVLKISGGHIRECCLYKIKKSSGFIWRYEKI